MNNIPKLSPQQLQTINTFNFVISGLSQKNLENRIATIAQAIDNSKLPTEVQEDQYKKLENKIKSLYKQPNLKIMQIFKTAVLGSTIKDQLQITLDYFTDIRDKSDLQKV